MRFFIILLFFSFSTSVFSQEIGFVRSGDHSIKLLKENNRFSLVYSDINSTTNNITENSFHFAFKESVYAILIDGFNKTTSHQIIIKASNDTIVKFEYNKIGGERLVKIKQNNLTEDTFGMSGFFKKEDIVQLFGNKFK